MEYSCCMGVCQESNSTLISIATSASSNTLSASSEIVSTSSSSSTQSTSSDITTKSQTSPTSTANSSSSSSPGGPVSTSTSSTKFSTSSSLASPSLRTQTPTPSKLSTSRTVPTTSRTVSSSKNVIPTSALPSSTAPSTPSYTTCATCPHPEITDECTGTPFYGYQLYHSDHCSVQNTHNSGNVDPRYPPIYSYVQCDALLVHGSQSGHVADLDHYRSFSGTLNACEAAASCALRSEEVDPHVYTSFDLHYLCSNSSWVCVQYYGANFRGTEFNVQDFDAVVAYGFVNTGNHD